VLHDKLPTPLEHIEQARLAVVPLESIVLLDLDHRQSPSLGTQCVADAGGFLLLRQKLLAGFQPFLPRSYLRKIHHLLL
jgi:hypothetical protein